MARKPPAGSASAKGKPPRKPAPTAAPPAKGKYVPKGTESKAEEAKEAKAIPAKPVGKRAPKPAAGKAKPPVGKKPAFPPKKSTPRK